MLLIPDAMFVVVWGPSDPLCLSLESKSIGHWLTLHDVAARDKRSKGADRDGVVTRRVPVV